MSTENQPNQIYFSRKYAWNLMADASKENLFDRRALTAKNEMRSPESSVTPMAELVRNDINKGERAEWINEDERRRAREMFIISDQIILPSGIFNMGGPLWNNRHLVSRYEDRVREKLPESFKLSNAQYFKPFILEGLRSVGVRVQEYTFDQVIRNLKYIERNRGRFKGPRDYQYIEIPIVNEYRFLLDSLTMSRLGIPTFTDIPKLAELQNGETNNLDLSKMSNVVILYLNSVRSPSPNSLKQAIEMKESGKLEAWKKLIRELTLSLSSGKTNETDIKNLIEGANEELQGTRYLDALPKWTIAIDFGAGAAAQLVPGFQALGWLGISMGIFKIHSALAEWAIKKKYPWLINFSK